MCIPLISFLKGNLLPTNCIMIAKVITKLLTNKKKEKKCS